MCEPNNSWKDGAVFLVLTPDARGRDEAFFVTDIYRLAPPAAPETHSTPVPAHSFMAK